MGYILQRGMFVLYTHPFAAKLIIYAEISTVENILCKQQIPLDLHVLGTSPAFTLSHDQTLSTNIPINREWLIFRKSIGKKIFLKFFLVLAASGSKQIVNLILKINFAFIQAVRLLYSTALKFALGKLNYFSFG